MKTVKTKICKFEELDDRAKKVARDWYRNRLNEYFGIESEIISEDFNYQLEELGYPTDRVEWSLNYCQGDGVAFYGKIDELDKVAKRLLEEGDYNKFKEKRDNFDITIEIVKNSFGHHYSHYNTMNVETDVRVYADMTEDEENEFISIVDKLEKLIDDDIRVVSRKLEKDGYSQIDYFYSDEGIDEAMMGTDYDFTTDGKRWTL